MSGNLSIQLSNLTDLLQSPSQRLGKRPALRVDVARLCGQRTASVDRQAAHSDRRQRPAAAHGGLCHHTSAPASPSPGLLHHLRHNRLRGGLCVRLLSEIHLERDRERDAGGQQLLSALAQLIDRPAPMLLAPTQFVTSLAPSQRSWRQQPSSITRPSRLPAITHTLCQLQLQL